MSAAEHCRYVRRVTCVITMSEANMNCCGCGEPLELTQLPLNGEPTWYGKYIGDEMIKAICHICIKDPVKKAEYAEVD